MTGKVTAMIAAMTLSALTSPAWAAAAEVRKDNSSLVVLGFLAFCALIVIAQVLPAIRSARQAAREEKESRTGEAVTETVRREE